MNAANAKLARDLERTLSEEDEMALRAARAEREREETTERMIKSEEASAATLRGVQEGLGERDGDLAIIMGEYEAEIQRLKGYLLR